MRDMFTSEGFIDSILPQPPNGLCEPVSASFAPYREREDT